MLGKTFSSPRYYQNPDMLLKKLLKLTMTLASVYTLPYNLQHLYHAERLISDRSSMSVWEEKKTCHSVLWNRTQFHKTHSVKMKQKRKKQLQHLRMEMPCVPWIY